MIRRNVPQLLSELLLKLWRPQPATILSPQQTEKSSSQQRRATPHHGGAYVQRAGQGFGGPRALEAACRFDSETRSVARLQGMSINQQGCHLTDSRALVPCILPSVISTGWIRVRLRRVPNKTRRSSLAGSGGRAWVVLGWLHVNSWVFIAETFGKAVSSLRPVAVVRRQKPVWRRASRLPGLGRGMSKVSVMVNLCDKAGRPNSRSGDPKVTNITKEG